MDAIKCPYCDKGSVTRKVFSNFQTQLGGIPFVVEEAKIAECDTCKRRIFAAKEIRRWEHILKKQLQQKGLLVTPKQVEQIRGKINLSVPDLAKLFAVTRQTVYGWEHKVSGGVQIGPSALLLGLLSKELNGELKGIYKFLVKAALQRGQQIKGPKEIAREATEDRSAKEPNLIRYLPNQFPRTYQATGT